MNAEEKTMIDARDRFMPQGFRYRTLKNERPTDEMLQDTPAGRILCRLRNRVGGVIRISNRGVPHLVVDGLSVCYFGRAKLVRVFTGYNKPGRHPTHDFKEWQMSAEFIENQRNQPTSIQEGEKCQNHISGGMAGA